MKLIPALEYEKLREESESWNKIFLHREGKFYHAYEWSAWLIKTVVCTEDFQKERGDEKILSVNKYKTKERIYTMCGFPVDSISKYIPDYEKANTLNENDLVIEAACPFEEATYETLSVSFEEWKEQLPFKEKQKSTKEIKSGDSAAIAVARMGVFHIISKVMSYPLESRTPAENMAFLSELKQDIAALL